MCVNTGGMAERLLFSSCMMWHKDSYGTVKSHAVSHVLDRRSMVSSETKPLVSLVACLNLFVSANVT